MKTIKRVIQFLTGIHRIHHVLHSYGYKLPFFKIGYFDDYGWVNFSSDNFKTKKGEKLKGYHNCTLTGIY